jgi:hypothetical protein
MKERGQNFGDTVAVDGKAIRTVENRLRGKIMAYDAAIGLNGEAITTAISGFYNKAGVKEKVFSGKSSFDMNGILINFTWSVDQAPSVVLNPKNDYGKTIFFNRDGTDYKGGETCPTTLNALSEYITVTFDDKSPPLKLQDVIFFAKIELTSVKNLQNYYDSRLTVTPVAVNIGNFSSLDSNDQSILKIAMRYLFDKITDAARKINLPDVNKNIFKKAVLCGAPMMVFDDTNHLMLQYAKTDIKPDPSDTTIGAATPVYIWIANGFLGDTLTEYVKKPISEMKVAKSGTESVVQYSLDISLSSDKLAIKPDPESKKVGDFLVEGVGAKTLSCEASILGKACSLSTAASNL